MRIQDVAVIGLGPAGIFASRKLLDSGIKTIIIDRKSVNNIPLRCAELVRFKYMQSIDALPDKDVIRRHDPLYDFALLYRDKWEQKLIQRLIEHDRSVPLLQTTAFNVTQIDDFWKVECFDQEKEKTFEILTQNLVICDGVESRLALKLNMIPKLRPDELFLGYGARFENCINHKPEFTFNHEMESIPMYEWFFSASSNAVQAGVGCLGSDAHNLKRIFSKWVHKHPVLDKKNITKLVLGVNPYKRPETNIYKKGLFICGAAGRFVNYLNGEGIYYAIETGMRAAQVIIDNHCRPLETQDNNYAASLNYIYKDLYRFF